MSVALVRVVDVPCLVRVALVGVALVHVVDVPCLVRVALVGVALVNIVLQHWLNLPALF